MGRAQVAGGDVGLAVVMVGCRGKEREISGRGEIRKFGEILKGFFKRD